MIDDAKDFINGIYRLVTIVISFVASWGGVVFIPKSIPLAPICIIIAITGFVSYIYHTGKLIDLLNK